MSLASFGETVVCAKKPFTAVTTTEAIWAQFHHELFRFIDRRVRDPETARDLLQEVFVKIHLRLPSLTQTDRLGAWVYRITRNTLLDYLKSPRRRPTAELPEELPSADAVGPDLTAELVQCLTPFLHQLPTPAREALVQTELGALSQKDYAARLGISYSGAKSRVQRARRQLHGVFQACCRITADPYGNVLTIVPRDPCGCPAC